MAIMVNVFTKKSPGLALKFNVTISIHDRPRHPALAPFTCTHTQHAPSLAHLALHPHPRSYTLTCTFPRTLTFPSLLHTHLPSPLTLTCALALAPASRFLRGGVRVRTVTAIPRTTSAVVHLGVCVMVRTRVHRCAVFL